ncbi:hypothetical protein CYMTET_31606 [Cymbomonas tetramitiformis]|uniref:Rhamnosyl O-methyltransferase n=1 Tax=Cymbomonas tetramitiformis TaxID=36881 RepID=A0AAE0FGX9_9CHLO|nr:hypothetical protein CYMTET_31606 [Cymbomonas tetramitiformis]
MFDPPFTEEDFTSSHLETIRSSPNCCGYAEFNSLGVWELTQYSAVLLMELDTRLMRPVPEMFRCIAQGYDFIGASGVWSPLNGGVFALRPSKEVLHNMKIALKTANYSTSSGYAGTGFPPPHHPRAKTGFAYSTNQGFLHWFFLHGSLAGKSVALRKAALVDMCVYNFQKAENVVDMPRQWCVDAGSKPQERAKILHKYAGYELLVQNRLQEATAPREAVPGFEDVKLSSSFAPQSLSSDFVSPKRRSDPQKENLKAVRPPASLQRALDMYEHAYEQEKLHQKQRFLGVRFGQDPPDALVIQEILFDIKPDVIIETGTNSGGSALYMSFLMEAINPDCKIITLDLQPLDYWHAKWHQAVDPRDSIYWKRRVTQLVGSSVSPEIAEKVHKMVGNAPKVLVSLDSHHAYGHVVKEIELYSPLVTVGSYMIVQDTKLGEPMKAADEFVAKQKGAWRNDERREYLIFTQHRNGWLQRLR